MRKNSAFNAQGLRVIIVVVQVVAVKIYARTTVKGAQKLYSTVLSPVREIYSDH
jgi:hypothetical protein